MWAAEIVEGESMFFKGLQTKVAKISRLLLLAVLLLVLSTMSAAAMTVVSQQDIGNVTVMEVNGDFNAYLPDDSYNSQARQDIANAFYATHPDDYDFLVFFTNFNYTLIPGSKAFYTPVKNDTLGKPSGSHLNYQELTAFPQRAILSLSTSPPTKA